MMKQLSCGQPTWCASQTWAFHASGASQGSPTKACCSTHWCQAVSLLAYWSQCWWMQRLHQVSPPKPNDGIKDSRRAKKGFIVTENACINGNVPTILAIEP